MRRTCRLAVLLAYVTYTDHVSTSFLLKGKNVKQIISIIRAPVDLHYKEQRVQPGYEFHQHGGWSLPSAGRLTCAQWQPCFNPPTNGSSFKTDERQDMQECLKFHVRFIDLGFFFHVLISPVNIWAERLWTEIRLNMNKSARVNVIWISAFHLPKCQSRREGVIIGIGWWGLCDFKQTSSLAAAMRAPAFRCMALERILFVVFFFFFVCFLR